MWANEHVFCEYFPFGRIVKRQGIAVKLQFPSPDDGFNNWTVLNWTWFLTILRIAGHIAGTSSTVLNSSISVACDYGVLTSR